MNLAGSLIIAKVTFTPESDKPNHLRTAMFTEILEAVHLPAVLLLAWFAGLARRVRLQVMCRNLGKASQPGKASQSSSSWRPAWLIQSDPYQIFKTAAYHVKIWPGEVISDLSDIFLTPSQGNKKS